MLWVRPRRLVPLLAALALYIPFSRVAWAGTSVSFSVNTSADGHAANPTGGVCETVPGNGQCSLRAALEVTNNLAAGDAVTISIPAGHYVLSLGELDLAPVAPPTSVTIQGSGAARTVLDGSHSSTVLVITAAFGGVIRAPGSGLFGAVASRSVEHSNLVQLYLGGWTTAPRCKCDRMRRTRQ